MKRPRTLSAAFVRTVKRPGRYGDGRGSFGLSLLVRETSIPGRLSRTWSQRLIIDGRPIMMGLGSYPRVTLAEARKMALHNRREFDAGRDPRSGGVPTFAKVSETVIEIRARGWKATSHQPQEWRSVFAKYAAPIMDKRIDTITSADVLAVLVPLWPSPSATRLRQKISAVMRWSVAHGYRADDPAAKAVLQALPNGKQTGARKHHRAIPHSRLGAAIRKIQGANASDSVKLAAEFLALTAARTSEVRLAEWSEIDLDARVWTIPAERTKAAREHRVPLSDRAVEILAETLALASSGVIFPSPKGGAFGRDAFRYLFKTLDLPGTPHGLRSSFRDWCGESGVAREVAEAALAHRLGDQAEQAYARSDLLERRREIMEAWAQYLAC